MGLALLVSAAMGAVGAVVAGLAVGAPAARGVVVGTVLVVVVFATGMAITQAAAALSPALSLLVALLTYVLQLVLLVVVLVSLERSDLLESTLDRGWIGGTLIIGTLVWSWALVRAAMLRTAHYHSSEGLGESPNPPSTPPSSTGNPRGDGGPRP